MKQALTYLLLYSLIALTGISDEYPAPKPPKDTSNYGKHFQRSMTLMETSTAETRNTVRILFYGQSIMGHRWHTMVAEDLQNRYPNTDFIIENKALGGFGSQRLVRTMHYDAIPFYPDLLVFHVYGAHDKYEEIIREIRSKTTSEIIMQSDHANKWPEPKCEGNPWENQKDWGDRMNYFLLPAIAQKYNCSWQPQRWEWVDYLHDNNLQPNDLLVDSVHLNDQGKWLMAELLKRYLVYLPKESQDEWQSMVKTFTVGEDIHWEGNTLTVPFTGNRIVALADRGNQENATVLIDGKKPSEHPECYTFTRPSGTPVVKWPCIQKISWKNPPVVEEWTAVCSDFNEAHDEFAFTIEGSKTGPDGSGNAKEVFTSDSGRIVIEPDDWVFAYDKKYKKINAPDGYKVHWKVELMGTDVYESPKVKEPAKEYPVVLASNLQNGSHTLKLIANDQGIPNIKAIRVYNPPYKGEE
jgi:hypothetical protein